MNKFFFIITLLLLFFIKLCNSQYAYNQAISLPGTAGNYAVTDPGANLSITGSFTVECWVKQAVNTGAQIVIQKRLGSAASGYTLYLNAGKVVIRTNSTTRLTGTSTIPIGIWTHIAATYNSATNVFTVYVNGVADGTITVASAAPVADADSLRIGAGFNSPFNGAIDEIRIWNIERLASDILSTMRLPLGEASGIYTGLVGSWRANSVLGGSGVESINGYTAYLRGTASFVNLGNQPGGYMAFNTGLLCIGATATYVAIPSSTLLNPTSAITMECWLYTPNTNVQCIIGKGTASGYPYRFIKSTSNTLRMILNGGTVIGSGNYGGIIPTNKWVHLCFTYNASNGNYAYYMNGLPTQTGTQSVGSINSNTDPVSIGGGNGLASLEGMVDEFRVSDYVKTPQQVLAGMYKSVDTLSDQNPAGNTVAYNFEGTLADYTRTGSPKGSFSGTASAIRFTQVYNNTSETPSPLDRFDAGNFGDGYRFNYADLAFGSSPTTVIDSIFMPQSLTISDVNVFVGILHANANDIAISLINPAGTTTRVLYPGAATNLGQNMITIFDDQADSTIGGTVSAPWSPRVKPTNALSIFNAQNSVGWWKLSLTDINPGSNDGRLVGWGIQFNDQTITGTGVTINTQTPVKYMLGQNYPNPFNLNTIIEYGVAKDGSVNIVIYDILGREVHTFAYEFKKAGYYKLNFNADNLATGIYFYTIRAGNFTDTKKMILIK